MKDISVSIHLRIYSVRLVAGDDGKPDRWCPLVYEYLPDFCYTCGIIGHTERACSIDLQEGGGDTTV